MKENITGSLLWENAMRSGLILGGISVAYELLSLLPGLTGGFLGALLGGMLFLVRIGKIILIILLFKRMMLALADAYDGVTRREARIFGFETTLLSSLVVAAFCLVSMIYLTPGFAASAGEAMQESIDSVENIQNAPEIRQQLEAQAAWLVRNFNVLTFVGTFLYCALWGFILTLIHSSRLEAQTPFDNR